MSLNVLPSLQDEQTVLLVVEQTDNDPCPAEQVEQVMHAVV
jgi:hypothetical protein